MLTYITDLHVFVHLAGGYTTEEKAAATKPIVVRTDKLRLLYNRLKLYNRDYSDTLWTSSNNNDELQDSFPNSGDSDLHVMHEAMLETDAEERNMDHDDASDVHHGGSVHVDRNGSTIIDDESRSDVDMDDACPSEAAIDDVLDDTDVHVEHGDQFRCSAFVGQEPVVTPMNNDVRAYDRPGLTSDLNVSRASLVMQDEDHQSSSERRHETAKRLVYRTGTQRLPSWKPEMLTKMYPQLFPFGRGGPTEERHVAVSTIKCIRHYLKLSSRSFATHPEFVMERFDTFVKSEGVRRSCLSLKCARDGSLASTVTEAQLGCWLDYLEKSKAAVCSGEAPPVRPYRDLVGDASRFIQHVQMGQQAMKGTAAESVMIRKKLHATATRFGSHQLFVTITPDDLVDPIAAAYAGFTPSVNVDGLSDAEVQIKNRDDMANTIAANPVACAMAFRAQLRIFIEEIIGWNLSDGTSQSRVMAKVIAFNAQVEEQGGQNLHAHILVTVVGLPHTHEALLQKLREHPNMTLKGIIQYVEAVKCNNAFSDFACQKEFTACDEEACQMAGHHQFVSVAVPAHIKNTTKPLGYAFPEPHTVRCPYSNPDGIINGRNDNTG
eukprot:gene3084-3914_t